MNAKEFEQVTGYPPQDDDLERANCEHAGSFGHLDCGICKHGKPVFACSECFARSWFREGEIK